MRALVTGATGFVGAALLDRLESAVVLSRNVAAAQQKLGPGYEVHAWDPQRELAPAAAFEGVDVVFHLAGEPVAEGRWNAAKKERIFTSRSIGTTHLVRGMAQASQRPPVLVSASAVGFYGSRGDEVLEESASRAHDFLAGVCVAWEEAAHSAEEFGTRVVHCRIGIVLGPDGGALGKMLLPFKLGAGGRLGSGRQWMPWVHRDDVVGLLLHAATHDAVRGPMNTVAPHPVTNRDFTRELARALGRPAILPAPAMGLRLALGEFAEVLLASQRAVPSVAERTGYEFRYPDLRGALEAILHSQHAHAAAQ